MLSSQAVTLVLHLATDLKSIEQGLSKSAAYYPGYLKSIGFVVNDQVLSIFNVLIENTFTESKYHNI